MTGTVHGYHFNVRFIPKWHALAGVVVERARAIGLEVTDDGGDLEPRAASLAFVGPRWSRFAHGGLRFDVLEERRALHADVVASAGNSGEHPLYCFGLATPRAPGGHGFSEHTLENAVALWLHQGSLTLRPWEDPVLGEELLAEFQVWTALEALSRVAAGQPVLGRPSGGTPLVTRHPPALWAPGFEITLAQREAEVRARMTAERMFVMAEVNLVVEA